MNELPRIFLGGTETEVGIAFDGKEKTPSGRVFFPEHSFDLFLAALEARYRGFRRRGTKRPDFIYHHRAAVGERTAELPSPECAKYLSGEIGIYLENGALVYVDWPHLEFSTAECLDPRWVVIQEKSLEKMIAEAQPLVEKALARKLVILKNNSDGKGNSYAGHENFLVTCPFFKHLTMNLGGIGFGHPAYDACNDSTKIWLSFITTGLIYTGSGKAGSEIPEWPCAYQISQRADFIKRIFGEATTERRPLINLRNEPLSESYGRLHYIAGDSNMAEWPIYLKMGTKALVLYMLQTLFENGEPRPLWAEKVVLRRDPVEIFKEVSRDLTCKKRYAVSDPRAGSFDQNGFFVRGATPMEIQRVFLEEMKKFYRDWPENHWLWDVLEKLEKVLGWLEDNKAEELDKTLDWRIKRRIMKELAARQNGELEDPRFSPLVKEIDFRYHQFGERGLYNPWLKNSDSKFELIKRIVTDEEIESGKTEAPPNTRAAARSYLIKHQEDARLADLEWDYAVLREGSSLNRFALDPFDAAPPLY